jgi:hypothetical protein
MEQHYLAASAWSEKEKDLRRVEYTLVLAIGEGVYTAASFGLPDNFLGLKDVTARSLPQTP